MLCWMCALNNNFNNEQELLIVSNFEKLIKIISVKARYLTLNITLWNKRFNTD